MFPAINETQFNGSLLNPNGNGASLFSGLASVLSSSNGHRSLSQEEQHLYNHHIIENFVESVREMNDVVLIPSKLRDLDPTPPVGLTKYVAINDDLYSYYQMINVVKNDLFEPHNDDSKKLFVPVRSRKISRQHRREQQEQQQTTASLNRNLSSSSLSSFANGYSNPSTAMLANGISNGNTDTNNSSEIDKASVDVESLQAEVAALSPLTSDQLVGQSSKQLTVQFIHHLRSLYTILEHFTSAADFITERYTREVEI